jgi:pyruvate/2-oxoglutarate dehydrogenase complex dihydrolipoamide dehydrogenase (E3) component
MLGRGYDYNFVVIGGGSAGLVASYMGASLKAKVALVERAKMGGDCLNTGCVPSKALLRTAKIFSYRHRAEEFGLKSINMEIDFSQVMGRVRRVINGIAPNDSVERYNSLGVHCLQASAKVLSPREVVADGKILRTKSVIIASGAKPALPSIEGLAEMAPLTSDSIWDLTSLPPRLLVLGGGAIGCELALAFQRLGSQVTLVERNPRLLPREDAEVGELLRRRFELEGMRVLLGAKQNSFRRQDGEKVMVCEDGATHPFDQVLVALGRKPNVEGMGLEALGVELRPNGTIETDLAMRTNVRGIFACGDVTGPYQFTHFASLSGTTAAINALFSPFRTKADLTVFPWVTFTDPEVARVGLSSDEAHAKGINVTESRFEFAHSDRARTAEETVGFVKVLTASGTDRILGATIVGPEAGELIQEFVLAMKHNLGLNKILGTTHAYPTLVEANRMAAGVWKRSTAPKGGLAFLQWLHAFRRG